MCAFIYLEFDTVCVIIMYEVFLVGIVYSKKSLPANAGGSELEHHIFFPWNLVVLSHPLKPRFRPCKSSERTGKPVSALSSCLDSVWCTFHLL